MKLTGTFSVAALSLAVSVDAQTPSYTREAQFHPVRMSYVELATLVKRAQNLARNDRDSNALVYRDEFSVSNGTATVRGSLKRFPAGLSGAPDVAYSASFEYSVQGASVASVSLNLADYERRLTVSGASPEQVDALTELVTRDIAQYETRFGGDLFRSIAGALLMCGVLAVPYLQWRANL